MNLNTTIVYECPIYNNLSFQRRRSDHHNFCFVGIQAQEELRHPLRYHIETISYIITKSFILKNR